MIEIPESIVLAKQMTDELRGKAVADVIVGQSPHKFAWFIGDGSQYGELLRGRTAGETEHHGGHVEMILGDVHLDMGEGVNITYLDADAKRPAKHQLLLEFADGSALVCKVQMYGGMWAFVDGTYDNPYYLVGREKPDVLSGEFSEAYFDSLVKSIDVKKISAKAFLATEQRIPGLGNGVLQDILWDARINPRTKLGKLGDGGLDALYCSVKGRIRMMAEQGGRDTEKDLYGRDGGYRTVMSKKNAGAVCPACGGVIVKENYMGGSVYYCPACQPVVR